MTQDHYFGRKVARTGAAKVLDQLADESEGEDQFGG